MREGTGQDPKGNLKVTLNLVPWNEGRGGKVTELPFLFLFLFSLKSEPGAAQYTKPRNTGDKKEKTYHSLSHSYPEIVVTAFYCFFPVFFSTSLADVFLQVILLYNFISGFSHLIIISLSIHVFA